MKILSIGEIIWDVYPDKRCIGGAPLNFAAHTSLLGAESALISAVGKDDLGSSAVEYVKDFGVFADFIKVSDKTTGICDVTVSDRGIPSYSVRRDTAYDNIILDSDDIDGIKNMGFDLFYFGTLIQRSEVSRRAVKAVLDSCHFSEIMCDVNLRPDCYSRDTVLTCLENATVLKISDEEEPILRELGIYKNVPTTDREIALELSGLYKNLRVIIITKGADGSYAYRATDGKEVRETGLKVKVASTVGAGDSFSAAFAVNYLETGSLEQAVKAGTDLSAFVVTRTEAVPKH